MNERKPLPVSVVEVIDGDSLLLRVRGPAGKPGRAFEARMYGIDAPEYSQPGGSESKAALAGAVTGGPLLAEIVGVDRYGRQVVIVYRQNHGRHRSINLLMVAKGYAHWYEQYGGEELGLNHAQRYAQEQRLGIWGSLNVQPPWEHRNGPVRATTNAARGYRRRHTQPSRRRQPTLQAPKKHRKEPQSRKTGGYAVIKWIAIGLLLAGTVATCQHFF